MSKRTKNEEYGKFGSRVENDEKKAAEIPLCAKCKKAVILLDGDNGCGIRTEHGITVTNCVPVKPLNG